MQSYDLVTFELGGEPYALELGSVREVLAPTRVALGEGGAQFVSGWLDLRGEAVPVVDLRARFDLASEVDGPLLLVGDRRGRPLALRVDVVREVSRGVGGPLRTVPSYFEGAARLVQGLVDDGPRPTVVLDAAELLSASETAALEAPASASPAFGEASGDSSLPEAGGR